MTLSKLHSTRLSVPVVSDKPHHPIDFAFPSREFGKKNPTKRSFQARWFKQWKWIHYNEENDSAYCFYCVKAYKENKLNNIPNLEKTYISTGFTNWKEATSRFTSHEATRCHRDAMLKIVTLPATTCDIGEMCSSQHSKDKHDRRVCFLKMLSNIRFLGRQGLPLRGAGDGSNSNFVQLFKLRAEDDPRLLDWFARKTDKYVSGEMQNRILEVMAQQVLAKVESYLHSAPFYTIMVDETTDISNREQVVICICWVDITPLKHTKSLQL